jgi:hypothetical protein
VSGQTIIAKMGVQDLMPLIKPTATLSQDLIFLNGKTRAWDISCALHAALGTQSVADQVWCRPPIPVHTVTTYLDYIIGMFTSENISVIVVTDGVQHPIKLENGARSEATRVNENEIANILSARRHADFGLLQKMKRRATCVRPDILHLVVTHLKDKPNVRVMGALFEAEWVCAHLERIGAVDAVYSIDSDCFILGVKTQITKIKMVFIEDLSELTGTIKSVKGNAVRAIVIHRDDALRKLRTSSHLSLSDDYSLAVLSCCLGNDYIRRRRGTGIVSAFAHCAAFLQLPTCDARNVYLDGLNCPTNRQLEQIYFCNNGGLVENYATLFNTALGLFSHCPIFVERSDGNIELVHLKPLQQPDVPWHMIIGFDPVSLYQQCGVSYLDAYVMNESCRYGAGTMQPPPKPKHPTKPDLVAPHGSILRLDTVAPEHSPALFLSKWLQFRSLNVTKAYNHLKLIELVNDVLRHDMEGAPREISMEAQK